MTADRVSLTWDPARLDGEESEEHAPGSPTRVVQSGADAQALVASAPRRLHAERIDPTGGLRGCLVCGHPELFTQRDFSRPLGVAIVVLAAVLAPFTHYVSLGVAALLDFLLYHLSGKVVVCYVCQSEHRGFPETPRHPAFDREIDERLRYGKKAVMGKPMRPEGTADAPEPEH